MASRNPDICKSPSSSELRHQQMYKMGTPPWKDSYRKKCRDQLAKNRHKFLDKFRNLVNSEEIAASVKEVMASEIDEYKSSLKMLESIHPEPDENIDDILMMFDEINAELVSEEREILNQYHYQEAFSEEALCNYFSDNLQANEVLCPICQRNPLTVRFGVVECQCGLRIDTEQDAITTEMIQSNLTHAVEEHSSSCNHRPGFNVFQQQTISNILMSCQNCDFLYIII